MDVSVRRSGQSTVVSALILIGCSLLCFAIGLGVGFAVWGPEAAPDEEVASVTPPGEPTPATNTVVTPPDPGIEHLESLEDVWPARHLFIAIEGTSPSQEAQKLLATLRPGGVILTARNVQSTQQATQLVQDVKSAVGLGSGIYDLPLIAADQEGGVVNRLNLGTAPGAREIASRRDLEYARQMGKTYAEACSKLGVGVMLAPVLDVFQPGAAAKMESRTFGSNEKTVAAMGLWFASGVIEGGVIPVVKYYPGMGGVKSNSRSPLPVLNQSTRELAGTMYPFAEAAALKIPGILAGHISVPAIDKSDPPRPASLSPTMINTVLRDRWEYSGVVVADDIALDAVTKSYSLPDAAVEALASGCDAVIVTSSDPAIIRAICVRIESAVQSGELASSALRESKKRLDGWQDWLRNPTPLAGTLPNVLPAEGSEPEVVETATQPDTQPAPTGEPSEIIYTVQAGDVLSKIASKYEGVTTRDIIEWNNLSNSNIRVGQELKIRVRGMAPAVPATEDAPEPEVVEPEPTPEPPAPEAPLETSEYVVQSGDVLSRIASKLGVTTQQIMEWNDLKNTNIQVGQKLSIGAPAAPEPAPAAEPEVVDPEPEVVAPEPEVAEPEPETVEPEPEEVQPEPATDSPETTSEMIEYTVVSGDILSRIASKFDVTTKELMEWNGLKDSRLSIGQKLSIGAPATTDPTPAPAPEVVEPEPEVVEPEPEVAEPEPEVMDAPEPETVDPADLEGATEYTVKSGDALSKIASQFNVTTKQIMEWNDLKNSQIRVGQKLSLIPGEDAETPEPDTAPETASDPTPAPATTDEAGVSQKKHSVQVGETLGGIAAAYGVSVTDLSSWNDLDPDTKLQAGRVLTIYAEGAPKADSAPADEEPEAEFDAYLIQSGDSPLSIATKYGITPEELMRINGITDVNTLRVGQSLKVPKE